MGEGEYVPPPRPASNCAHAQRDLFKYLGEVSCSGARWDDGLPREDVAEKLEEFVFRAGAGCVAMVDGLCWDT